MSDEWTVFKAALIAAMGRTGAAEFLEYAAAIMRTEANIELAASENSLRAKPDYALIAPSDLRAKLTMVLGK